MTFNGLMDLYNLLLFYVPSISNNTCSIQLSAGTDGWRKQYYMDGYNYAIPCMVLFTANSIFIRSETCVVTTKPWL